jgi:CheY-like chemotaxis protein
MMSHPFAKSWEGSWKVKATTCNSLKIRLVERSNFDLIISDQNMPFVTGIQLAEAIRRLEIPFILLTGLAPRAGQKWPGITAILSKPVSLERLGTAIGEVVGGANSKPQR